MSCSGGVTIVFGGLVTVTCVFSAPNHYKNCKAALNKGVITVKFLMQGVL
jgi:hypothetical protein